MERILSGLACVLAAAAASVQFNDPDPWLWAPLYGFVALCSGATFVGKPFPVRLLSYSALVYSLAGMGWFLYFRNLLLSGVREPLWESLGLGLSGFVLAGLGVLQSRHVRTTAVQHA